MNRLCVGWDPGTVGCCIAAGPYTRKPGRNGETVATISPSSMLVLPLAPSAPNPVILETVCTIVSSNKPGVDPEVLWGQQARKKTANGTKSNLLKFPKLTTLSDDRLLELSEGKPREFGFAVIKKEQAKTLAEIETVGWTRVDFLAAGFKAMWKLAAPKLDEQFLRSNNFPEKTPFIDVVVPRPSLWRLNDDHALQQALSKALKDDPRIASIHLCDESHVALFGMTFNENNSEGFSAGQVVAVSDLGGGTCDNASYIIESLQPFRASEAIGATGRFAGAQIMYSQFHNDLNDIIRPCLDLDRATEPWEVVCNDLVSDYISNLAEYTGSSDAAAGTETIDLVSRAASWLEQTRIEKSQLFDNGFVLTKGGLKVTDQKMKSLFKPYVRRIGKLCRKQILDTEEDTGLDVDLLLVVGGFSKNAYLQTELRAYLKSVIDDDKIRFPPCYDKSTVAKGAARYAADQSLIVSRKLKATIGFKQDLVWEEEFGELPEYASETDARLKPKDKYLPCVDNMIRCLFWKGQTVRDGDSASFTGKFFLKAPLFALEQEVYAAGVRKRRLEHNNVDGSDGDFLVIDDPSNEIVKLGDMGMESLNIEDFEAYAANQAAYDKLGYTETEYRITATFHGEELEFVLQVPSSGHFECNRSCAKRKRGKSGYCPGKGRTLLLKCPIGANATFVGGNDGHIENEE